VRTRVDRLYGKRIGDQTVDLDVGGQSSKEARQPRFGTGDSALAELLDEYRRSVGNPETGLIFHSGDGLPVCVDKVGRRVIRRALEAIPLPWYGWHAFRRGLASNLYELGAQDIVVQRILRHSKPHVTRERFIKVFDRTVLDAVDKVQTRIEELRQRKEDRRQLELKFVDASVDLPLTVNTENPTGCGFPPFSSFRPPSGHQRIVGSVVSYSK